MLKIEKSFEEITTETFLATMFKYGFEKVDSSLLVFTLEEINQTKNCDKFDFSKDRIPSKSFNVYVDFNGLSYKPKKNKSEMEEYYKRHVNNTLLKVLDEVNFEKVVNKKLTQYGIDGANMCTTRFCKKEMKIKRIEAKRYFDAIEEMNKHYEQEAKDKEQMKFSTDYIEWLIGFTSKQENGEFNNVDINYNIVETTDEESALADKLGSLVDVIYLYYDSQDEEQDLDISRLKIGFNGTVIEIGSYHHNGTVEYARIVTDEKEKENVPDYSKVIKHFRKARAIEFAAKQIEEEFDDNDSLEETNKKIASDVKKYKKVASGEEIAE